jgi:hypothetical protein
MIPTLQNCSLCVDLEEATTWSAKVGPAYNEVPSTKYWTKLLKNDVREFGHEAPAMGGWLSGLNDLPVPPNWTSGIVKHGMTVMFDGSIVDWTDGSRIAVEFDNRIADGKGHNWNFSNQINLSEGGMWQVDPETGKWQDTGVQVIPKPFIWNDLEFTNRVDFTNVKASFLSMKFNEAEYQAPANFQNLNPMKDATGHFWKRGANLQVQQCRQTAGLALLWAINVYMIWSPDPQPS